MLLILSTTTPNDVVTAVSEQLCPSTRGSDRSRERQGVFGFWLIWYSLCPIMAKETRLTKTGYDRLKAQLEREYQRLEEATRILRELSGSSDDYDDSGIEDAKREKVAIEDRIDLLENTLANAVILEEGVVTDTVMLGSLLRLVETAGGEELWVQVVSAAEASAIEEPIRISDQSPAGRSLMGQKVGTVVKVDTGRGVRRFRVAEIGG